MIHSGGTNPNKNSNHYKVGKAIFSNSNTKPLQTKPKKHKKWSDHTALYAHISTPWCHSFNQSCLILDWHQMVISEIIKDLMTRKSVTKGLTTELKPIHSVRRNNPNNRLKKEQITAVIA